MPADTNTPIYGFLLQGTGNNPNSWGENLNDEVFTIAENAIGGCLTITGLTGGAYTLTQANAVYATIKLQGTLSSDLTITVPSTANKWTFINELTHAGFYVLIKTSGNTARNIPHDMVIDITCDGTNCYRSDEDRIGEVFYSAVGVHPGCLECTNQTPLRASAVDLFAAIGTNWGSGNGATTFGIPDAFTAGRFLRSRSASNAFGSVQSDQNKAHTHNVTGTLTAGNLAIDSGGAHTHTASSTDSGHTHTIPMVNSGGVAGGANSPQGGGAGFTTGTGTANISTTVNSGGAHTHTISGVPAVGTLTAASDGGTEARPTNITMILNIRY